MGEAVLAHQPAEPAAQGKPGYSSAGHDATRDRQVVELSLAIELTPRNSTLSTHGQAAGIDVNSLHRGEVDHYPAINSGAASHVVASSANGDLEAKLLRNFDSIYYVRYATASYDEGRALIDEAIVHLPRILISRIGGCQQLSQEGLGKLRGGIGNRSHCNHGAFSLGLVRNHPLPPPRSPTSQGESTEQLVVVQWRCQQLQGLEVRLLHNFCTKMAHPVIRRE